MMLQNRDPVISGTGGTLPQGVGVTAIHISELRAIGHGIERPEHVLVDVDGRVFASDKGSAVAEVHPDGRLHRMGRAGGEPNGIALNDAGRFLIANFGLGALQELDPESGAIRVLASGHVGEHSLQWLNDVLVDSTGVLWASVCSVNPDLRHTIAHGTADGYLFRLDPAGGDPAAVAGGVNFPNCMALDGREEFLYVVRTLTADVVRFRIEGAQLGAEEPFGPPLGGRRADEYGSHAAALLADRAVTRRWGMADGCAFDGAGNLWVTLARANRIVAITPEREVMTIVEDPEGTLISGPTSIAWGGADLRDVYIGSLESPYIVKGRSSVPGHPMVHQRRRSG
jgi:sugar lactone lactonase YvrE